MPWNVFKIINGEHEYIGQIEEPADCFGDDLYDFMQENEWITNLDEYNIDGDNDFIAMMHKDGSQPDFGLYFAKESTDQ